MRRSGHIKWSELRVGMVLLFGFAVLLWASFTGTGFSVISRTDPLAAYFPEVNGLVTGAPVWMAGLEVGYVDDVAFMEKDGRPMVHVGFRVRRKVFPMITTDARVAVGTMGLMGDKYLDIRLGDPHASAVVPGAELSVVRSADLTTAFTGVPELMDQAADAVARLSGILERVDRGEGFLGRMTMNTQSSANIDSLVVSAQKLFVELNTSQEQLTATLQETSRRLQALADAVESKEGSLGRLLKDTTLYTNLSSLSARAERLFRRLDEGEGAAGKLVTNDEMYEDVRTLLSDLQALIADVKANPKKYFKLSLF
jgi:phospholipid/cholesterol/gamma-HCH transport system substrate-binding protein